MRSEGITARGGGHGGDVAHVLPLKARPIPQRKPDPPSPIQLSPIPEPIVEPKPKKPRRRGVTGPRPGTPSPLALERSKVERLVELYEGGMSAKDAGKEVGIARPTALKYLRQEGVEIRSSSVEVDVEEIKRLYLEERLPTRAIGERIGVSGTTVMKYLKAAGVQMRPKGTRAVGAKRKDA